MQTETPRLPLARRAAQYVRMSTEHQQYSTENQSDKILEYAARIDIEIVRTYAYEGKSGLNIGGREGLQKLLADVRAGKTDFGLILVYDVSRWGRFQDADESAHYVFICKQARIRVVSQSQIAGASSASVKSTPPSGARRQPVTRAGMAPAGQAPASHYPRAAAAARKDWPGRQLRAGGDCVPVRPS